MGLFFKKSGLSLGILLSLLPTTGIQSVKASHMAAHRFSHWVLASGDGGSGLGSASGSTGLV
jgi:hypothetical protein